MGITLAYALLSVLMYSHNVQTGLCGKKVVRPISASRFQGASPTSSMRPMGIVPKVIQRRDQGDEIDITQRRVDMNFVVQVYSRSLQKLMILTTLKQMSIDKMVKVPFNLSAPFLMLMTLIKRRTSNSVLVTMDLLFHILRRVVIAFSTQ